MRTVPKGDVEEAVVLPFRRRLSATLNQWTVGIKKVKRKMET